MANESWVTGKKYRILTDLANKKWSIISFINKAADTIFNDGKSAQTKLGAIDGITSDLNGESETIAASIKAVNQLNNNLGGCQLSQEGNDFYIVGADSVRKKLGSNAIIIPSLPILYLPRNYVLSFDNTEDFTYFSLKLNLNIIFYATLKVTGYDENNQETIIFNFHSPSEWLTTKYTCSQNWTQKFKKIVFTIGMNASSDGGERYLSVSDFIME